MIRPVTFMVRHKNQPLKILDDGSVLCCISDWDTIRKMDREDRRKVKEALNTWHEVDLDAFQKKLYEEKRKLTLT